MARVTQHQLVMSRGAITPLAHGRIDLQDYTLGLKTCKNWLVSKYGGLVRMAGTLDLAACEDSTNPSRLLRFVFNQDQAYGIEFSDQKIRFFTSAGQIESGGSPYEIASPYLQADLWDIKAEAIGDVVYLVCDGYQPRTLTRTSDTSWALAVFDLLEGPWLPQTYDGVVLKPSGTGDMIPKMTSATAPSGTVSASAGTDHWHTFDRDTSTAFNPSATSGWVRYDFSFSQEETAIAYMVKASAAQVSADNHPTSWSIEGQKFGSSDWVVLDMQVNVSDWLAGETRIFEIANSEAYHIYRINYDNNGTINTSGNIVGADFQFLWKVSEQTAFDLTASAVTGINGGVGFTANDVGRLIRGLADDGLWRIMEIAAFTSTTVVTVKVVGPAPIPNDQQSFSVWQLQAFSDEAGWPSAVTRYKDRLGLFRTDAYPTAGWLSRTADYDHHGEAQPVILDDDAISFNLSDGFMDEILWASSGQEDLLLGTEGGIRIVGKRDQSSPFSPTNHEALGRTDIRAGNVDPVWIGGIMVFVQKALNRLYETAFSLDEGGYVARELTMLAEHLFRGQVKELHYQRVPMDTLWVVLVDGGLCACTYDRQQQVFGVSEIEMAGTGATVESMAVLPTDSYDVPLFVVGREVNGSTTYRVEKLTDPYRADGNSTYTTPHFLMAAAPYSGAATSTLTGLGYLEGETVAIYDNTLAKDLGDAVVSSGQITVPDGATVTSALVGLRYTSELETLPPPNVPEDGAVMGPKYVPLEMHVDVFETYGLKAGNSSMFDLTSEADHANSPSTPALHTGLLKVHIEEGWSEKPTLKVTTDRAYPATIRAVQVDLDRGAS